MHSFALPLAKPIRLCSGLFTGFLGSLALALAGAGPVAANPFGVERQGGDAIAAIKSLTPEQAWKLAAEFPGVVIEIEIKGHGRQKLAGCLPLNRLESLDAETAKALAGFRGPLHLNGLTPL